MTITFNCEHCGKVLRKSDDKAGLKATCPDCAETLLVPSPNGDDAVASDIFLAMQKDLEESPPHHAGGVESGCPMCGQQVPASAAACKFCGAVLRRRGQSVDDQAVKRNSEIIDINDVISTGWRIFKADMGTSIRVVVVAALLNVVAAIPTQVFSVLETRAREGGDQPTALTMQILWLLSLPIAFGMQVYLNCGLCMALLKIARGKSARIHDLLTGGHYAWRGIGATIVYLLLGILGLFCCILPGVIELLMFTPYLYVLVDEDSPGIECLWRANALTVKNRVAYFVILLACFGMHVAGGAALYVGAIFTTPLALVITAVAYCKMSGQRTAD